MSTYCSPGRTLIGKIVGAHGIRGALRIHPLTDFPERFLNMKQLYIEIPGKPHRVLNVTSATSHDGKGQILVTVEGVSDRDRAETLRGALITVAPEERVTLPEGEYWIDSLIGLDVVEESSGECLGRIEDVMSTGSNDIYQVRTPDGTSKVIPAIADVVRDIDIDSGVMKIAMLEGLWD